jgi:hypothetical protein
MSCRSVVAEEVLRARALQRLLWWQEAERLAVPQAARTRACFMRWLMERRYGDRPGRRVIDGPVV